MSSLNYLSRALGYAIAGASTSYLMLSFDQKNKGLSDPYRLYVKSVLPRRFSSSISFEAEQKVTEITKIPNIFSCFQRVVYAEEIMVPKFENATVGDWNKVNDCIVKNNLSLLKNQISKMRRVNRQFSDDELIELGDYIARSGRLEILKFFIEELGLDPNCQLITCSCLEYGSDVRCHKTPLIASAAYGHYGSNASEAIAIIEYLLSVGARFDTNQTYSHHVYFDEITTLEACVLWAVESGNYLLLEYLIEKSKLECFASKNIRWLFGVPFSEHFKADSENKITPKKLFNDLKESFEKYRPDLMPEIDKFLNYELKYNKERYDKIMS